MFWCPRTDSNRGPIDYKSIALPAELQGHGLFCRINSLFNQVIQYKINLYLARMLRMLAVKVPQCRAIVTHLSVYGRYGNPKMILKTMNTLFLFFVDIFYIVKMMKNNSCTI